MFACTSLYRTPPPKCAYPLTHTWSCTCLCAFREINSPVHRTRYVSSVDMELGESYSLSIVVNVIHQKLFR